MGEQTKIEWCHHTFNAWIGCHKVSPACKHCYAEVETFPRVQRARGLELWGADAERHVTSDANWRKPLAWNRDAEAAGERRRVFCSSLSDVFERHQVPAINAKLDAARARIWKLIEATPWLDWLLLTKRPENIGAMVPKEWLERFPRNIWLGATCENQEEAEKRLPHLLSFERAVVHFVSGEPLLGDIDFTSLRGETCEQCGEVVLYNAFAAAARCACAVEGAEPVCWAPLRWVIPGGESGANARSSEVDWFRSLVKQCADNGCACFLKQFGADPAARIDDMIVWGKKHPKGGDPSEWPEDLRVRQFPEVARG